MQEGAPGFWEGCDAFPVGFFPVPFHRPKKETMEPCRPGAGRWLLAYELVLGTSQDVTRRPHSQCFACKGGTEHI
jgi:hypothetical protein